jgi:hypothetical protein
LLNGKAVFLSGKPWTPRLALERAPRRQPGAAGSREQPSALTLKRSGGVRQTGDDEKKRKTQILGDFAGAEFVNKLLKMR